MIKRIGGYANKIDLFEVEDRFNELKLQLLKNGKGENLPTFDTIKDDFIKRTGIIGEMIVNDIIGGTLNDDLFGEWDITKDGKFYDVKTLNISGNIPETKEEFFKNMAPQNFFFQEKQIMKYSNKEIIPIWVFISKSGDAIIICNELLTIDKIMNDCLCMEISPYSTCTTGSNVKNYIIPWSFVLKGV